MRSDHVPHMLVGFMLHIGDAEQLPGALGLECINLFLSICKKSPHLTDGEYK